MTRGREGGRSWSTGQPTAEWQNGSTSTIPTCSCSCSVSVPVPVRTYLYIATAQLVQVDELFLPGPRRVCFSSL